MGILLNRCNRVVVQGITGREGRFHAARMKEYGTQVVAGVTPGKGSTEVDGIPVFDTVEEAVRETGADASVIFVPHAFAADAIMEASEAGISLAIAITEGIPVHDMIRVMRYLADREMRLIGPNCPGVVTAGEALCGIMPGGIFKPGPVGIVSRSGTLTYEVVNALSEAGVGQSTCVGVGGDPIIGTRFAQCLELFEDDPLTKVVVLIGEIGGRDEEDAAEFVRDRMQKPVIGFISGRTAPEGKRMGHAGAIISGRSGTAGSKIDAFRDAGIVLADTISDIVSEVRKALRLPAAG